MGTPDTSKIPLWVKIDDISLEAWKVEGISRISSRIGAQSWTASFARVLIEIDAAKGLIDTVEIWYKSLGKSLELRVEYAWVPSLCEHCKTFGHFNKACSKNVHTVEASGMNGRGRGGFNNRSIGGYGGIKEVNVKNVPVKNSERVINVDECIITNEVNDASDKGKNKVQEDVISSSGNWGKGNIKSKNKPEKKNISTMNRFDVLAEDIEKEDNSVWKEVKIQVDVASDMGISVSNEVIKGWSDDMVKFYKEEWSKRVKKGITPKEKLKSKIDELGSRIIHLNRNLHVNANMNALKMVKDSVEATGATSDGSYEKFYSQTYKNELLKVKELQWEGKQKRYDGVLFVEEESNGAARFMVQNEVSNVSDVSMAQVHGLTQTSKQDEVKLLIREERISMCAIVETRLRKKSVNSVCENLNEDWLWVSNAVESRKGCRIIVGWDRNVIGANLITQTDQNHERERKPLWENLVERSVIVADDTWALMGDFNVALNVEDCTNSFSIKDKDMQDFRRCLEILDLEDIAAYGMFYTWIQKRDNPETGILKKLDRVLGNSNFIARYGSSYANFLPYVTSDHCPVTLVYPETKACKPKSFRFVNFLADKENFIPNVKNNWFIDVKVLRAELKKVQQSLDKYSDSVQLREEEYIYCNAYKDAVLDEEKLLKQKTKIDWLKPKHSFEGDDVPLQFVNHFQKFFGTEDEVFPIDDIDSLFDKKLDPGIAANMIRPVLDNEIKEAMFDIKDDKVAGPDGFTSKFFKAAWSVVGSDVCDAVREFFTSGKLLGEFNANLISLIPKLQTPLNVADFRPIACCYVVYKCISKVVTNRLKEGLNSLVDCNQSAFIPGRQISDNILLTQEFMRGYTWKSGVKKCPFKVDIQKAYDTVNWDFLRTVLHHFGFHSSMVHWIMGDPMSPYLFSMCYGLYPSMAKSTAFFGNVPIDIQDQILLAMPFRVEELPVRYLGVPLSPRKLRNIDCRILIEKQNM
ncbi:RNA-directed DNA polymerase, eukaryota, reverse transcriptase zinc-binding domain protein [Tanacetum coccineum]